MPSIPHVSVSFSQLEIASPASETSKLWVKYVKFVRLCKLSEHVNSRKHACDPFVPCFQSCQRSLPSWHNPSPSLSVIPVRDRVPCDLQILLVASSSLSIYILPMMESPRTTWSHTSLDVISLYIHFGGINLVHKLTPIFSLSLSVCEPFANTFY